MIKNISLLLLLVLSPLGINAQTTIFYNANCEITMKDLASHYRVAKVDTAGRFFQGEVLEYWLNDSLRAAVNYDINGARHGALKVFKMEGALKIEGAYSNGQQAGVWRIANLNEMEDIDFSNKNTLMIIDSVETCLAKKEMFNVSIFVRKKDYPSIYPLIANSKSSYDESKVFNIVEEPPRFPGGMKVLGEFIRYYMQYPKEAMDNNIKGKVIIEFSVNLDGSTSDYKVTKSLGYGCDEEAIRVLKLLPDWVPGYQRGRAVLTKHKLPFTFQ